MKIRFCIAAAILSAAGVSMPANAQTGPDRGEGHILNLTDVDIQTLVDDISIITGYTFAIHPDVRATVTVTSQVAMSTEEVFEVFLSTLRVNGFAAVPAGRNIYAIVPEAVAAETGVGQTGGDNAFVTQVFRLENFSSVEAAKMVQPLLGPFGKVTASPASNALIVVEYGSNIDRIRSVIARVDEDSSVTRTIALNTVPAGEMQTILTELREGGGADGRGKVPFSAVAVDASNTIILRGDGTYIARIEELIKQLDVSSGLSQETRVIRLNHSDAATVLPILQEVAGSGAPASAGATNTLDEVSIALHEPSNSLVISALPDLLSRLSRVVSELDVRREQVLVEAIIVDVSDMAARELGLQFLVAGENGNVPFASQTFGSAAPNILALTGALADENVTGGLGGSEAFQQAALGSLLGLSGGTIGFGGQSGGTLFNVILNALETDDESNILSTPSILTLNNEAALVSVGQNIPISSGQVLGDANLNPFQTTERQDIGVILNVVPRIGDDNTIRLEINQEVSSIDSTVGTVTTDFILNQSQLQTKIVADDGELIVLGGLIQTQDTVEREKIPLLGDIPGLGRLFQNELISRETGNLMVFIRPTIVRDADEASAVTNRSYNYIRAQQILANDGGPASIDQFVGEVLNGETPDDETDGQE